MDRVKCGRPSAAAIAPAHCVARYVNPIQERRQKNGPAGAEIAPDAAAAVPPPKPKKEPKAVAAPAAPVAPAEGQGGKGGKAADASADADCGGNALSDVDKQLRALKKKLRQIEIIEAKGAVTQEELGKASKKAEIEAAIAALQS